jgi:hypothetical protein
MTHAAAATRTLRSPRRRPHGPAAWERAGTVSGVVGTSALVISMCAVSSTPSANSTPAAVRIAGAIGKMRGDDVTFSEQGS